MMNNKCKHRINCQSSVVVDEIVAAINKTKEIATLCQFELNDIFMLTLAVEEACHNAYEYCLKANIDEVMIDWSWQKDSLIIVVKHEGKPFRVEKNDEINYGKRGRGLQLILHIMDDVRVESCGSFVKLVMEKGICKKAVS